MLLLGVFFDALEQNGIGVAAPILKESWGLSGFDIGFLNTMTFTATALGRIVVGLVVDRYGRRNMLMINLIIYAGGSLMCALARRTGSSPCPASSSASASAVRSPSRS